VLVDLDRPMYILGHIAAQQLVSDPLLSCVQVLFHLDRPMYILGYIAAQQRVYLIDKQYAVVSYTLLLSLVEFKTLVMRSEVDDAYGMLDTIPAEHLDGCAPGALAIVFTQACLGALGVRHARLDPRGAPRRVRNCCWSRVLDDAAHGTLESVPVEQHPMGAMLACGWHSRAVCLAAGKLASAPGVPL
jgi:Coatomer WD associated region